MKNRFDVNEEEKNRIRGLHNIKEQWTEIKLDEVHDEVEEAAKPDFLDLDKDGDKKESMKKAAKEVKEQIPGDGDVDIETEIEPIGELIDVVGGAASEIWTSFLDKLKADSNNINGVLAMMISKCREDGCEWIFVDEEKGLDGKCDCENQGVVDRIKVWWDDLWN